MASGWDPVPRINGPSDGEQELPGGGTRRAIGGAGRDAAPYPFFTTGASAGTGKVKALTIQGGLKDAEASQSRTKTHGR